MKKEVTVNKKLVVVIIALFLILNALVTVGFLVNMRSSKDNGDSVNKDLCMDVRAVPKGEDKDDLAKILADMQVYFCGIEDAVINDSSVVYLENDKENKGIYMRYVITDKDTGEVLEVTDLISAGDCVEWVPGEKLSKGEHTLIFNEAPFFQWKEAENGYVPLTQANNEVVFTVM